MDENQINAKLKRNSPNYLGTLTVNELENLRIRSYPAFLVVNMDKSWETGSHWIAIKLELDCICICDSLGEIRNTNLPIELVNFLHLFRSTRHLFITPQLH